MAYEIHARMALEVVGILLKKYHCRFCSDSCTQGDLVEYNACLSQLKVLYENGVPGKVEEFTAYRILMLLHGLNRSGTLPISHPLTRVY